MTRMPRIVIFGESAKGGLLSSLITAFQRSGCIVNPLGWGPWEPTWLASAAYRQPMLGVGFRRRFRRQADELAENGPADLIVVGKGALLNRRSINYLRSTFSSPVVCWNADSPFDHALSNRGGGIPETIRAYDAYITWADDVAERLSAVATRVIVIPFAWDPELMQPTVGHGLAAERIVFIGTGTRERSALLQSLAHLNPMIFGNGWPEIEGADIRPPITGPDFPRVVGEAKWNINLLRPQNARSHNMRTFELIGAGGTQAAPLTNDHQRFLSGDSRTVLFRDMRELESILRSDPKKLNPRLPTVLEGHTYADRTNLLLTDLNIRRQPACPPDASAGRPGW